MTIRSGARVKPLLDKQDKVYKADADAFIRLQWMSVAF